MRKSIRRGFTIVELVIVIAVIAILAATLIPTFSSLVSKANLSADMQAVRQMNTALQADETLHGKPTTIEGAMRVIANAGYDADNWNCLTSGYEVYWDSKNNRCVLYNATTASVEYPKEYSAKALTERPKDFQLYNQTFKNALSQELNFGSSSAQTNTSGVELGSGATGDREIEFGSSSGETQKVTLSSAIVDNLSDFNIKSESAKVYGYSTQNQGGAVLESVAIYDEDQHFTSSSDIKANVFHLSIPKMADDATAEEKADAEKAAGNLVYSLFVQMNTGTVTKDCSIVVDGGTTLNVSDREWQGVKLFSGYFGTPDDENPITINGMELSQATSYVNTYTFQGSGSTYYLCGFFGGVTSNAGEKTLIENVTFKNVHITDPASDYSIATNNTSSDSNCAAIIGGIISTQNNKTLDVTLRNITVDESCSVKGVARVGGLVAFVGGSKGTPMTGCGGKVTFEHCDVKCSVSTAKATAYGTCGGIVGFVDKMLEESLTLTLNDCSYSGTMKGYWIGGIIGQYFNSGTENVLKILNATSNVTSHEFTAKSAFGYIVGDLKTGCLKEADITNAKVEGVTDSPYSVTWKKEATTAFKKPFIGTGTEGTDAG